MLQRSIAIVFPLIASLTFAGNGATQPSAKAGGNGTRSLAARRPAAATTTSFATESSNSLPAETSGTPLDRSPIPAYPPVAPGPPQTVSGQCFVFTDGGQRITLEQVEVSVYPQREFEWYAQEIHARAKARFEVMKSIACPANFAALSIPEMDRSLAAAGVLQHDLYVVWQSLPIADASTRTGPDGRFSVTHQVAPPYVIFAAGSRTVGHETEFYRWQISSKVMANPLQLDLSNADLR